MGVIMTYAVMLGFKDPLVDEDDPDWDLPGFAIDNKLIEDAEPYFTVLFTVRASAPRARRRQAALLTRVCRWWVAG
jgi:hypothetical protein